MPFGPIQAGIFWFIFLSGVLMGVPERVTTAVLLPSPDNIGAALFSSGLLSVFFLLRLRPF
jgi:hypothetical protein